MNDPRSPKYLPTEIWNIILAFATPELPDCEDIVEASQTTITPPASFLASRSSLFHLCLMSKRLDVLARPFLFQTIVIWEADSLLLLWQSLKSCSDLGRYILQMACWVPLTREAVVQEMVDLAKKKLEHSPLNRNLYQNLITQHNVPQLVLFDILCRSTQLTMLSLLVPRSREGIQYSALMAMITENRQLNDTSATPTTLGHGQGHGISCSLASIQLCLDRHLSAALMRREEGEQDEQDMGFDHQDYWPLLRTSKIIRLHCYGDDASFNLWFQLEEDMEEDVEDDGSIGPGPPPEGYLGTVQEIRLDASSSGPKSLYYLCRHAHQLQALRVIHRRHSQDSFVSGSTTKTLDSGLLMRASTLRHLHLDFYDSVECKSHIGPDGRLASLPQFHHLETLHIQLQTLFGRISAISRLDVGDMFPSSLAELTLDDQWLQDVVETEERIKMYSGQIDPEDFQGGWIMGYGMTEAGFWNSYRKGILKMLIRLCDVLAERLPDLRRVHYVSDFWSRRGWERNNSFDEVQESFCERGIEFYAGEKAEM
ncbi:hypothetical protein P154DRAFT_524804 [Amniculicola lignicola CBS 123094]|uniref:Uncharacterized protein n=1 Tax=Amniculicola lignicola CBS 123094 TaxID=1392246 RepID=A0A6A5W7Y5_9PLEO|nr:hypothetical protein P154DRAFT_524804 [Amniculicola lignicola CBS 123094]